MSEYTELHNDFLHWQNKYREKIEQTLYESDALEKHYCFWGSSPELWPVTTQL
jgi:hypothetical protein